MSKATIYYRFCVVERYHSRTFHMTTSRKKNGVGLLMHKEHCICKLVYIQQKLVKQVYNISLKNVGMTVPKIRENVYMQHIRMGACNNNNISLHPLVSSYTLLFLHALSCVAAYVLPVFV